MLPKANRITESADYARLFQGAPATHGKLLTVKALPAKTPRAGVVVSKRTAVLATDRNRIKRVARAVLREQLLEAERGLEVVVIAKPAARSANGSQLKTELTELLAKV